MFHRIAPTTAILTYRATQKATYDGDKIPENVIVSATYVRQNATWMAASHRETLAEM